MRYVAAYMLAAIGGNKSPSEADLKKILDSAGIEQDQELLKKITTELNGKCIEDLVAAGRTRLATVPSGGGAAAPAAGGAAAAPAEQAKGDSAKKEEKKEEEEEEDEDMGFGLFD